MPGGGPSSARAGSSTTSGPAVRARDARFGCRVTPARRDPAPWRRAAAAGAIVAGLALLAPAAAPADDACPGADTVIAAQDPGALTGPSLCLLNAPRAAAGLEAVSERPALSGAAAAFSAEMVGRSFFGHRAPGGPDLVARV